MYDSQTTGELNMKVLALSANYEPLGVVSWERAITQPSLLDNTTVGRPIDIGLNTLSQLTQKLLQSQIAIFLIDIISKLQSPKDLWG